MKVGQSWYERQIIVGQRTFAVQIAFVLDNIAYNINLCVCVCVCVCACVCVCVCVTESDKMGHIAGKYICLLNNVYLHFCVSYNNSVSFSKISIAFYISGEKYK